MALLIETKKITSIRAFGTWYCVDPDSVEIDCMEIVHCLDARTADEMPLMQQNLDIYQFGTQFKSATEPLADLPKSHNPLWSYKQIAPNVGIRFFDNELCEVVTLPLCLVEAFAAFDPDHENF